MSKAKESASSQQDQIKSANKISDYPMCAFKKQARLVCLNPKCQQYAFFCTNCENDQCQIIHHHGDKLLSVSFNQYIKKVLKTNIVDQDLEQALNRYAECLEKLKKDVEEFIEKQLNQLQEIKKKSQEMGEEEQKLKQKLRKKEFVGIKGCELDQLWQRMIDLDKKDRHKETIEFLSIKQEQIKQISDNFEKVNTMELEQYMQMEDNDKQKDFKQTKPNGSSSVKKVQNEQKGRQSALKGEKSNNGSRNSNYKVANK